MAGRGMRTHFEGHILGKGLAGDQGLGCEGSEVKGTWLPLGIQN